MSRIRHNERYQNRRMTVAAIICEPLIVYAGRAVARNYASNPHPYRAGSSYLYLGGPVVEGAAWLIEPGNDGDAGCTLFRPGPGPDDALWIGESVADEELAELAGIDVSRIVDCERLEEALAGRTAKCICPPCPKTIAWAERLGLEVAGEEELRPLIEMRLVKSEQELAAMRVAADVTVEAHLAAMQATRVGASEAGVEAAFAAVLVRHGCRPSFTPIVTVHGEVLHGYGCGRELSDGSLMLVDAGAEEPGGYACDVTRTYPVSGKWTGMQRDLYATVLQAMRAAIEMCRPAVRYRDVHHAAARNICEGLVAVGLLRGDIEDLACRGAYSLFFPHGVGHLIGLDVHDMEDFGDLAGYADGRTRSERFGDKFLRLDRDLVPGMTVTIEPGVYLVPAIWQREDLVGPFVQDVNRSMVDRLLDERFGGIRIEETVCVRAESQGPEVLTSALPSGPDEVLKAMV